MSAMGGTSLDSRGGGVDAAPATLGPAFARERAPLGSWHEPCRSQCSMSAEQPHRPDVDPRHSCRAGVRLRTTAVRDRTTDNAPTDVPFLSLMCSKCESVRSANFQSLRVHLWKPCARALR